MGGSTREESVCERAATIVIEGGGGERRVMGR